MIPAIKGEMFRYLNMYYKPAIVFSAGCMFLTAIWYFGVWHKRKKRPAITLKMIGKMACLSALFFYIYLVIGITLLSRDSTDTRIVNLRLFGTMHRDYYSRLYFYENILLFIPLAILLYVLMKPLRRIHWSLLTGFIVSMVIEITQYVTRRGRFEVDDILTNITGMLFGYMFAWGCDRIRYLAEQCRKRH